MGMLTIKDSKNYENIFNMSYWSNENKYWYVCCLLDWIGRKF